MHVLDTSAAMSSYQMHPDRIIIPENLYRSADLPVWHGLPVLVAKQRGDHLLQPAQKKQLIPFR